jgi:3-dehydroquinate synthase
MKELTIQAGANRYPVQVGAGLLKALPARLLRLFAQSRFAVVTDGNVEPLYAQRFADETARAGAQCSVFSVKPGEGSKSFETLSRLLSGLARQGFTRSDIIVALGGGVVGDLAGFAASAYLRGVKYVQVPTTLLAQIDSAIGGKTAVNLPEGKNLAGAFYHPALVCADTQTLRTLPAEVFADGMAELIKNALIRDADMFAQLEDGPVVTAESPELEGLIARCIGIKQGVVAADERDTGERMLLNFGHTIGHGIERLCAQQGLPMSHGRAVASGMAAITQAGERMGLTEAGTAARVAAVLQKYGLPCGIGGYDREEILRGIAVDKKNVARALSLVLVSKPGEAFLHRIAPSDMADYL